ncbi:hypothetical protein PV327_010798 [Microctonus hyperodae]|uniref:Uncharacterized protein n=1 Tax=Microctonus hyperodae TaxID=165561 RepID=A0AA39C888_MICHY|nr:hypothetical protein PV327_010798 [Microctonus hyperodae]
MEDISEDIDVDNIIDDTINKFNESLKKPQEFATFGAVNDLDHLLTAFDLNDDTTSEHCSEIIQDIIQNSDSHRTIPRSSSENIKNPSAASSSGELKKKSSKSSAASFFSRLLGRKKNAESSVSSVASIPSVNSDNDRKSVDSDALKLAEHEIEKLKNQGPAGIVHLSLLSRVVNRKINVWTSSMNLCHEVGKEGSGESLNVQYHSSPDDSIPGHWTLLGNEEPKEFESNLNDCLFNAIAAQTGHRPCDLREATIDRMKRNINSLGNRVQVLAKEKECGRIILMIGGAKYTGKNECDAKKILDNSQKGRCDGQHNKDSVENYSENDRKTAFKSREDQDRVAHQALSTDIAQEEMKKLNEGSRSRTVRIPASKLKDLPQGVHYNDGKVGHSAPIKELILVLCHHAGQDNNAEYDVFVHTFYPVLEN